MAKPLSKLRDELDKIYSQWIRRKDADSQGMVQCYTCGKWDHWKGQQNGHYISRKNMSTRWHDKNCKPQCVACNIFNQGNGPAYARNLIKEYGPGILEELEIKKNNVCKMSRFEYELLINEYKEKVKTLPEV